MSAKKHRFNPDILREYDIRGEWGETLNENDAYILAETLTSILTARKKVGENHHTNYYAVVARDGRESGRALSEALIAGFRDCGIKAIDLGLLPTPALYFAEAYFRQNIKNIAKDVLCAVMVTGSHNPPSQNGFKIVADGKPFFGQDIQALAIEAEKIHTQKTIIDNIITPIKSPYDIADRYVERLRQEEERVRGGNISAVWDAGGGATAIVLRRLLPKLCGSHFLLHGDIDASFAVRSPDPTMPAALDALQSEVGARCAQVGLAFDGDGDRLLLMLPSGKRLSGDRLMLLFAEDLLEQWRGGKDQKVVPRDAPIILCDVKTSPSVVRRIGQLGGEAKLVPTGHANIKRAICEEGAAMAGEVSGHLFFNDRYGGYDDAIYAAVRLCAMLRGGFSIEKSLAALPASVSSDELRLRIAEEEKFAVVEAVREKINSKNVLHTDKRTEKYSLCTLDGVRVEYGHGWWLLRASNTEGVLVLRAEAGNEVDCRAILLFISRLLDECGFAGAEKVREAKLVDC